MSNFALNIDMNMSIETKIKEVRANLNPEVRLVAVSKTYPAEAVMEAYELGQRVFGESRPQEMTAKWEALPKDIEWHMIGHLQTNKVKMILPYVSLIESLNSDRLVEAIEREAAKLDKVVDCLLEIQVAQEESKTGWEWSDVMNFINDGGFDRAPHIRLRGVMGIASYSDDMQIVEADFKRLRSYFDELKSRFGDSFDTVSMGMSGDYKLAIECGSTSVRVGSFIFGNRSYL